MNINLKELNKQIKKSRSIIWAVRKGTHYITNRYWAVRFDELPREVLIQLFSIFTAIPQDGETLVSNGGGVTTHPVDVEAVFKQYSNGTVQSEVTDFLKVYDYCNLRIIKVGEKFAYVNDNYLGLIKDIERSSPFGTSPYSPIFFNDNTLIILPVRSTSEKNNEMIEELLVAG